MASDGTQANGPSVTGFGPYITLSGDGRYLAFYSEASNLVAGDSNGLGDFFILDQVTGTLERVPANNIYGVNGPTHSTISADGHCLAFASYADDLVPGDTNGKGDIFVYDRIAGTTERIQANLTPGFDAASPVMSADGNFVAFSSFSPDLGFKAIAPCGPLLHEVSADQLPAPMSMTAWAKSFGASCGRLCPTPPAMSRCSYLPVNLFA